MSICVRATACALVLLPLWSCTATAPDPQAQSLVESVAGKNDAIVRLTLHAIPTGKAGYTAVASTASSKLGKPSDPEDLKAIRTGEIVVLDEPGGIDVTVPIRKQGMSHTAVAGVTLKATMDRDAAIVAAKSIAAELEQGLKEASMKKEMKAPK